MNNILRGQIFVASCLLTACSQDSRLSIYWGKNPSDSSPAGWNTVAVLSPTTTCSGSLIGADQVLTASHCVEGLAVQDIRIRFGDAVNSPEAKAAEVRTIFPEGGVFFPNFDLATIKLSGPAPSPYAPVEIGRLEEGDRLLLAGYGQTESVCQDSFCRPRLLEGETRTHTTYDHAHGVELFSTLANPSLGQSAPCFGDSGGPVYARRTEGWVLVGITNGASLLHTPHAFDGRAKVNCRNGWGVHTRVDSFRAWIHGEPFHDTQESLIPTQWSDWLSHGTATKPAWYTVDRLLRILAVQPSVPVDDIPRLLTDPVWSQQVVEGMTALNLKPDMTAKKTPAKIEDLRPLAAWKSLQTLSLIDISAGDFGPLSSLAALNRLSIVCADYNPDFSEKKL